MRATSTSFAPFFAALRAVTRPMPLVAPVITIVCSPIGFSVHFMIELLAGRTGYFGRTDSLSRTVFTPSTCFVTSTASVRCRSSGTVPAS